MSIDTNRAAGEFERLRADAAARLQHPFARREIHAAVQQVGERGRLILQPLPLAFAVAVDIVHGEAPFMSPLWRNRGRKS